LKIRSVARFLPLALGALATHAAGQSGPAAPKPFEIFYTARLQGHARIPSLQTTQPGKDCAASREATELLHMMREMHFDPNQGHLLLGLGDNFAPHFYARTMVQVEQASCGDKIDERSKVTTRQDLVTNKASNPIYKDLFVADEKGWFDYRQKANEARLKAYAPIEPGGFTQIPFDNVADFFKAANYSALVPGKHDFYFGPERLLQLAKNLRMDGVSMLGSNLKIESSLDHSRPAPAKAGPKGKLKVTVTLPSTVYPWATHFTATASVGSLRDYDFWQCRAADGNPALMRTTRSACRLLVQGSNEIAFETHGWPNQDRMLPSQNYAICVARHDQTINRTNCSPFTIAQPFLTRGYPVDAAPPPYYFSRRNNLVVVGVIDQALQASLPEGNSSWLDFQDRKFTIRVVITDPKDAIEQALQACRAREECNSETRIILLAQMPEERAGAIARKVSEHILAVIAEANLRQPSPEQTITRAAGNTRPLIVSPGPILDMNDPKQVTLNLQRLTWSRTGDLDTYHHDVATTIIDFDLPPLPKPERTSLSGAPPPTLKSIIDRYSAKQGLAGAGVHEAILHAMWKKTGADVALLQKRDFFMVDQLLDRKIEQASLQQVLDVVMWKGDFLIRARVKGAVLSAAMKRSEELAGLDAGLNKIDTESNRELVTLGIYKNAADVLVVNGEPLDDDKIYIVALPDYLAFGDTAYPQFAAGYGFGRPRIRNEKELVLISTTACAAFTEGENCTDNQAGLLVNATSPDLLFDRIHQDPPDVNASRRRAARAKAEMAKAFGPQLLLEDASVAERAVNERPVWSITLEKISGSFARYGHNSLSEKTLADTFQGVNSAGITQNPESLKINTEGRLQIKRATGRGFLFALGEWGLGRERKRNDDNTFNITNDPNRRSLEAGYRLRFLRGGPRRPEPLLITSYRWQRDLFRVDRDVTVGDAKLPYRFDKDDRHDLRVGLRWETGDPLTYAEFGYQYGARTRIPTTLRFDGVSADARFLCPLTRIGVDQSLDACIKAKEVNYPVGTVWTATANSYVSKTRFGPFTRFSVLVPVPLTHEIFSLRLDGQGEQFHARANDFSVDIRRFGEFSAKLSLNLWKNASVGPKYRAQYFQTAAQTRPQADDPDPATFDPAMNGSKSIKSTTFSLDFEYRFQWRPHLSIGALRSNYPK
jgi:5'-nucleotidase, C-terminal domain